MFAIHNYQSIVTISEVFMLSETKIVLHIVQTG